MPISAEQWRALTGSAKVRKWSLAPRPGVKASSLLGNLSSTPPSDWKGYYSLMVLLCVPVLYRLYSVSMVLVMYLVSGGSLGTHGLARASLHYHNIIISVGGLTADVSTSSSDGAWGGVVFLLLNGILYVAMVMTALLFGVQEHRGRDKHQWKLTQQIHHLDLFWLNSGPECEVIVDTNTGRLYATLSMDSLGALQHVHCRTPCTSMKPKNSKTTFNIFLGILSSHFILQLSTLVLAMLLLLAGDVERNPGPVTVTRQDHSDVCHYLKDMDPKQLRDLGGTLGLHFGTLTKMNDLPAEMVAAWLRAEDSVQTKSGPPSWESLIKALNVIGQNGIASTIDSERKKSETPVHSVTAGTTPSTVTVESQQPTRVPQEKSYGKMERAVLDKNQAYIKSAFSHLLCQILDLLINLQVNMDKFRVYISGLFPGILDQVPASANITDFFAYITNKQLWTFSNFNDMENLTKEYLSDNPQAMQLVASYKNDLSGYITTTSLVVYIAQCEDCDADPDVPLEPKYDKQFYQKLSLKLKTRVTSQTLEYIDDIWRKVAKFFMLPSLSALLDSVTTGSLVISWYIPVDSAQRVRENVLGIKAEKFFRRQSIIEVKLDQEVVYYDVKMCLLGACEDGDIKRSMGLLQDVPDFNFSQYYYTPLGAAAENGHHHLAKKLLKSGVEVDERKMFDRTPLMDASSTDVAQVLLDGGADVNARDNSGVTALMLASQRGRTDLVELLINHHADMNQSDNTGNTALIRASVSNHLQVVQLLLKHHPDVNARAMFFGFTALMYASRDGYAELVKILLEGGADPNIADDGGNTALIWASVLNHLQVVQLLLKHHPDVNARTKDGFTALMYASRYGYVELVKALLGGGADPNIADDYGNTALIVASRSNQLQVVQLLLKHHPDVNARTKYGFTALMHASRDGYVELVKILLEGGADPNIADDTKNWPALFFACNKDEYFDISDDDRLEMVHLLINHGADVDFRDKSGVSANDVALTHGFQEISDLILSHSRSKQQNTINEETRRRVQTAGDYFRALLDFLLPDKAKKREGLLKEDERMESGVTVKDTGKKKRGLWARLTRRHNAPPTIPT